MRTNKDETYFSDKLFRYIIRIHSYGMNRSIKLAIRFNLALSCTNTIYSTMTCKEAIPAVAQIVIYSFDQQFNVFIIAVRIDVITVGEA